MNPNALDALLAFNLQDDGDWGEHRLHLQGLLRAALAVPGSKEA